MDERRKQILSLEKKLADAVAASDFSNSTEGQMAVEWLTQFVTAGTNDILSDKYVQDHDGYLRALGEVAFARKFLIMLSARRASESKIREELDVAESET